jgi:hypothetical protein
MQESDELVHIFTGSEISALLLKSELEEIGVGAIIQNDYLSGISVGVMGGTPTSVDLFILQADMETAEPVITEFRSKNN